MGLRDEFGPFLDRLASRLRDQGFRVSPEQMIDANDVRLGNFWTGNGAIDADFAKFALAPIFCTSPQEQARFHQVFDDLREAQAAEAESESPARTRARAKARNADPVAQYTKRLRWLPWIIAVGIVAIALMWTVFKLLPDKPGITVDGPTSQQSGTPTNPPAQTDAAPADPGTQFVLPPRPPAAVELLRPGQERVLTAMQVGLALLPLLIALAYLMRLLRASRVYLIGGSTDQHPQLKPLPIQSARAGLYDDARITAAITGLRALQRLPTRRLDPARSIDATVRNGGFPRLEFAVRSRRPGYVVLIERQAAADLFASAAQDLADRMYRAGLEVWAFTFSGRPFRLAPLARLSRHGTYDQLKQRYHGDTLIVIGEPARILHGTAARAMPWQADLRNWSAGALLSSNPCETWDHHELGFHDQNLAVAPFGSAGLNAVTPWLSHEEAPSGDEKAPYVWWSPDGALYPALLTQYRQRWFRDDPPEEADALQRQLKDYLREDGLFLLAALVAYPQFNWPIALYLNQQLFRGTPHENDGEARMLRVASLPWCRQGSMPDYLRERLVRLMSAEQLARIQACYDDLLNTELGGEAAEGTTIEIVGAARRQDKHWWQFLRGFFATTPPGPYRDAIFQHVMLTEPDQLVRQEIPRETSRQIGGRRWDQVIRYVGNGLAKTAAATAVVVVGLLIGRAMTESWLENRNLNANNQFSVRLFYQPATGPADEGAFGTATDALARRLTWALEARGFNVSSSPMATAQQSARQGGSKQPDNAPADRAQTGRLLLAQAAPQTQERPSTEQRQVPVDRGGQPLDRSTPDKQPATTTRNTVPSPPILDGTNTSNVNTPSINTDGTTNDPPPAADASATADGTFPPTFAMQTNAMAFDGGTSVSYIRQTGISRDGIHRMALSAPTTAFTDIVARELGHLTFDVPIDTYDVSNEQITNVLLDLMPVGLSADLPALTIDVWLRQPARAFQDRLQKGGTGPVLMVVPAGTIGMTQTDPNDAFGEALFDEVAVTIPVAFAIGKYEVTFDEYDRFARETDRGLPDDGGFGRGRLPVINITPQDAQDYAEWLAYETGEPYRLPTSTEWEYAARGGPDASAFETIATRSGTTGPVSVGSRAPNALGLHDTRDNVREITADCGEPDPASSSSPRVRSATPAGLCTRNIVRGGGWDQPVVVVSYSAQTSMGIDQRAPSIGFRVVRDLQLVDEPTAAPQAAGR